MYLTGSSSANLPYAISKDIRPGFSRTRLLHYPAKATIYRQGDPAGPLYRVTSGAVRLYEITRDGRRRIESFEFSGEVFGVETGRKRRFFAEAIHDSTVAILDAGHLDGDSDPVLKTLERTRTHLALIDCPQAIARLARFLLDLDERQGGTGPVTLPMSRADIADYLGLTIETISRCFKRLKEQRAVRLNSARSVVLDRPALAALCE